MPANAPAKIRILIVDDMTQVRQGLRTILQLSEYFEVVGEACNGLEAIRAAESLKPEVVLMDLEMPELGGLEATRRIKEQQPEIGIVILTIHGSDEVQEQAMRAGSDAFVEKEAPTEHLIAAIREVRASSYPNTN
jgi:DNA-binding NarL/FixJ family response regulator